MEQKQILEISWASIWRLLIVAGFAVLMYLISDVLLMVVLAVIFSSALDAPVSFLEKKRIPRLLGTILIYLLALGVFSVVVYTIVPVAAFELTKVLASFKVGDGSPFALFDGKIFENITDVLNLNLEEWTARLATGSVSLLSIITSIFGGFILLISTTVFTFYLAVGKNGVDNFLTAVLPLAYEGYVLNVLHRVRAKIGRWLQAQIVLSLIMGVAVGAGLWLLGVRYSLILGIMASIFETVPVVGPVFVGIVAISVAATDSFNLAFYTLILFLVLQQLENNILVPLLMRKVVGLHPLIVFISLIIGTKLLGFVGLLIAVPFAVTIQEVVEDWTQKKQRKAGMF